MEEDRPLGEIVAAGYAEADVARVTRLIKINEYKRRQAPVGIASRTGHSDATGAIRSRRASPSGSADRRRLSPD
jgi:hypothetical protein